MGVIGIAQVGCQSIETWIGVESQWPGVDAHSNNHILAILLLKLMNLIGSHGTVHASLAGEILQQDTALNGSWLHINELLILVDVAACSHHHCNYHQ